VLKHVVLLALLAKLVAKTKPLRYIETHAGAGGYDLRSPAALKNHEFLAGIAKIYGTPGAPAAVARLVELVRRYNDGATKLDSIDIRDVAAGNFDDTAVGLDHPVDHPHRRRLSASRRTDQHADLAFADRERQIVDGGRTRCRESLRQVRDLDHGFRDGLMRRAGRAA